MHANDIRNIPTDFENAKYGITRPNALGETPIGAKLQGAADSLGDTLFRQNKPTVTIAGFDPFAGTTQYAVKNKGGNWVDQFIDKTLSNHKRAVITDNEKPAVLEHYGLTESELAALPKEERLKMYEPFLTPENKARSSINNWIDTKLRKYIKTDLATPTDPVRELHDEGVSHLPNIDDENINETIEWVKKLREKYGFPTEGNATTDLGKAWETRADNLVYPYEATEFSRIFPSVGRSLDDLISKDPDAVIHTLDNNAMRDLGFEHSIDELQNAMLDENLPQQLRLRPKDVDKMSVKDALRHVSKINDYRIKQADKVATANRDIFATHFPPEHEYDNGYRWHELKMPETDFNPNVIQNNGKFSILEPNEKLSWKDPETGKILFNSPEEAKASYNKAKNYQTLDEALKNEGDQMGHCVGGYTEDVANGVTRIFTLRDKKNKPHVTIEAVPAGVSPIDAYEANKTFIESNPKLLEEAEYLNNSVDAPYQYISGLHRLIKKYGGQYIEPQPSPVHNIEQIKGKGNLRVADKYHDYVHAFLNKNEKDLGEVYDTNNVDLVDTHQPSSIIHPDKALIKNKLYSGKLPRFLKRKELDDLAEKEYNNLLDNYEFKDVDNGNEWINAREAAEKYHPGKPELQRNFIRGAVGYPLLFRESQKRQKFTGDKKLDDILNKVRPYEDLSQNSNYDLRDISPPQENQEYVVGYHIPEDVARPLAAGKLTNKDIGDNNLQGYAPDHVGGAYFWSHPTIARFQKDRWHESVPDEYQHEAPIMKFRMKKGEHNLVPDEDTDAKNWQDSFTSGSFATTTPVDMKDLVAIYSNNPEKTRQHIIESMGKLNNKANNFTPEHLEALKEYQAVKTGVPNKLKSISEDLANKARAEHPEANIEFATTSLGIIKGGEHKVPSSDLTLKENGTALHTHGYNDRDLPSINDFEEWSKQPNQKYYGIIKPHPDDGSIPSYSSIIIEPKQNYKIPSKNELMLIQKDLYKKNPNLVERLDKGDYDAAIWAHILEQAGKGNIDLHLHNMVYPYELKPDALVDNMTPMERGQYLDHLRNETLKALDKNPKAKEFLSMYQKGAKFGLNHEEINNFLRYGNTNEIPWTKPNHILRKEYGIDAFDDFIKNEAPRTDRPITLFRATDENSKERKSKNSGEHFGYLSTSINPDIKNALISNESWGHLKKADTVKYVIPEGSPVVAPNLHDNLEWQKEIILPRYNPDFKKFAEGGSVEPEANLPVQAMLQYIQEKGGETVEPDQVYMNPIDSLFKFDKTPNNRLKLQKKKGGKVVSLDEMKYELIRKRNA
jgi:hypothetical protein